MIRDKHIELVTGYLQGTLSTEEKQLFQSLIESGELDVLDVVEMERLYKQIGEMDVPEPGLLIQDRFYKMLNMEKAKNARTLGERLTASFDAVMIHLNSSKVAVAVAVFLIGLLIGDFYSPISKRDQKIDHLAQEFNQMREMVMISLLENDSPVERLKAVNISQQLPASDLRIVDALLYTLKFDTNVNVKVAAINALVDRGHHARVREELVNALKHEPSPLVQIALADAMVELQEQRAIDPLRRLLEQESIDFYVRTKFENTILALL